MRWKQPNCDGYMTGSEHLQDLGCFHNAEVSIYQKQGQLVNWWEGHKPPKVVHEVQRLNFLLWSQKKATVTPIVSRFKGSELHCQHKRNLHNIRQVFWLIGACQKNFCINVNDHLLYHFKWSLKSFTLYIYTPMNIYIFVNFVSTSRFWCSIDAFTFSGTLPSQVMWHSYYVIPRLCDIFFTGIKLSLYES